MNRLYIKTAAQVQWKLWVNHASGSSQKEVRETAESGIIIASVAYLFFLSKDKPLTCLRG